MLHRTFPQESHVTPPFPTALSLSLPALNPEESMASPGLHPQGCIRFLSSSSFTRVSQHQHHPSSTAFSGSFVPYLRLVPKLDLDDVVEMPHFGPLIIEGLVSCLFFCWGFFSRSLGSCLVVFNTSLELMECIGRLDRDSARTTLHPTPDTTHGQHKVLGPRHPPLGVPFPSSTI
jgi:hypothetical protein